MKYIVLILSVLLISGSGLGYWYHKNSQKTIEQLNENNAKLEVAIETNQQTIDNMVEQAELNQKRITELSKSLRDAEQYNSELRRLFQEHNLTLLAEEKPGLIENRINEATDEVFDSIMQSTRSR